MRTKLVSGEFALRRTSIAELAFFVPREVLSWFWLSRMMLQQEGQSLKEQVQQTGNFCLG